MNVSSEIRNLSSTKSLQCKETSLDKSFMSIRNNNVPEIEPCGTPAVTYSQDACWPFRTTLCFRQERKSRKSFKRIPETPFWFSLRSKPSFHTLLKALDISKKTLLTSNP